MWIGLSGRQGGATFRRPPRGDSLGCIFGEVSGQSTPIRDIMPRLGRYGGPDRHLT